MKEPVLVAGTDGVGTKLKIAFLTDKHDTVGQDCVAMCVNDVLCQGAQPLFFLDYIATGKVHAEKTAEIVKGVADGCLLAGCSLVGGETAEMPGFYQDGEYDMAGFAVGIVDRDKIVDGHGIKSGDVLIGIPSSGVHSNGFSLIRKLFFEKLGMAATDYVEELGATIGETLLTPTRIYSDVCRAVLPKVDVKGMIHITGGGFFENIPRVIPEGLGVKIDRNAWEPLPIFRHIQSKGGIEDREMFSTFNMGIGLIMIVSPQDADRAVSLISAVDGKSASDNSAGDKSASDKVAGDKTAVNKAAVIGVVTEGKGVTI
jgi:phosphoribosylformylglycinamidine cyclo-ligase